MSLVAIAACAGEGDGDDGLGAHTAGVLVNRVGLLGGGGCSFTTVGAAITAASAGDTILLQEGETFFERLGTISKDLTIRSGTVGCGGVSAAGAPVPMIDAGGTDRVARITADVTFRQVSLLDGALILPSPSGTYEGAGLWVASGTTTLDDATVAGAECNPSAFDFNLYGAGIHVSANATLIVQGSSVISGNLNWGLGAGGIYVAPGGQATIEDDTLIGVPPFWPNVGDKGGGGLLVEGSATLRDDVHVTFNSSDLAGGGLYIYNGGSITLEDRVRIGNNVAPSGAGVFIAGGELVATGSVEIADNTAETTGGGIRIGQDDATLDLTGATITGNTAPTAGGGLYLEANPDTTVTLSATSVDHNTTDGFGGGIANLGVGLDIDGDSAIADNTAGSDGGGLYLSGGDSVASLDRATIDGNRAARGGGLIALAGASLTSQHTTVSANAATGDGGGAFVDGPATVWTDWGDTNVVDNTADRGAGIHASGGTITASFLDLRRNIAATEGGGARVTVGATLRLEHGATKDNAAGTMGGGFAVPGGLLALTAVNVSSNDATSDGGGAAIANAGRVEASDTWFLNNTAGGRGGGIAVLSYAEATDPQLVMWGTMNQDGCVWRGAIGANEYCSDIRGNTATGGGGGLYLEDGTGAVTRTAIRGNTAPTIASAVWMRDVATGSPALAASNLLVVNNGNAAAVDSVRVAGGTFVGEAITSADNTGAPFRFTAAAPAALLQRSIVWDTANLINASAFALGASCTMFRAVTGATVGPNIAFGLDPMFVATPRGNYRLGAISVNAIDQCTIGLPVDLDNAPRPVNVLFDRGAFERQ